MRKRLGVLQSRLVMIAIVGLALASSVALAQPKRPLNSTRAGAPTSNAGSIANPTEPVALNFKDAELDAVIGAFGHLIGRTFVVDPRVKGRLTLETPKPVPRLTAYQMLQSALRMQGFAIVESGGLLRVVPEADAKLQGGRVGTAGALAADGAGGLALPDEDAVWLADGPAAADVALVLSGTRGAAGFVLDVGKNMLRMNGLDVSNNPSDRANCCADRSHDPRQRRSYGA
jgi:hypothetical protein